MIDGVRQALQRVYALIPRPILEAAFTPEVYGMTLDECIKQQVLLSRVKDDISVRGGKIKRIILDLQWTEYTSSPSPYALGISGSYSTYRIPASARENRDISCVLSVRFPYSLNTHVGGGVNSTTIQGNSVSGLACAALQAQTGTNLLSSPNGIIRPGNVLQLDPPQYNFIPWQVTVRLAYDDNFSGMDVSTIQPFCQLVEYAVKSYIYTKLIMTIETNLVVHGLEIGVMKDIVSTYADAAEKYDEMIIKLGGAEHYDPTRLEGILRRMVPKR